MSEAAATASSRVAPGTRRADLGAGRVFSGTSVAELRALCARRSRSVRSSRSVTARNGSACSHVASGTKREGFFTGGSLSATGVIELRFRWWRLAAPVRSLNAESCWYSTWLRSQSLTRCSSHDGGGSGTAAASARARARSVSVCGTRLA